MIPFSDFFSIFPKLNIEVQNAKVPSHFSGTWGTSAVQPAVLNSARDELNAIIGFEDKFQHDKILYKLYALIERSGTMRRLENMRTNACWSRSRETGLLLSTMTTLSADLASVWDKVRLEEII